MKNKKNILITGGLGFIGFNFIKYLIEEKQKVNIFNIDNINYSAEYKFDQKLKYFNQNKILNFYIDINNQNIQNIIKTYNIEGIINFAAQTHVDFSIKEPLKFIHSNINGVVNLLEIARKYNLRFHQVSTDEVYGSVDPYKDIVNQQFRLKASSPYSASKLSADLLCLSYFTTFNTKITISRTTNNYGPYQDPSKLIPKAIQKFKINQKIGIYGQGLQMRNWIFVKDHCSAIWKIYNSNNYGQIYNVGSDTLLSNIEVIKIILNKLNLNTDEYIQFINERPGHDFAYHLCSEKIKKELNWKQEISFEEGIQLTLKSY